MDNNNKFGYFYGLEADKYTFCRIPKALIKDSTFKGLSTDAKLLYGLLLDRMSLSVKNQWFDEKNRVYIIYTIDNIAEDLGCGRDKAVKVLNELDDNKGIGLCQKVRKGLGKPNIIYVKNFADVYARGSMENQEYVDTEVQNSEFQNSRIMEESVQEFGETEAINIYTNNTNINNTKYNDTEYINNSNIIYQSSIEENQNEGMDDGYHNVQEIQYTLDSIKERIDYDFFMTKRKEQSDYVKLMYKVIVDVLYSNKKAFVIGGEEYSYAYVRGQLIMLNSDHIEYIIECLQQTRRPIKNIKSYLLKALINAPDTIDDYYLLQTKIDADQLYNRAQ